jgi:hypothetical protein
VDSQLDTLWADAVDRLQPGTVVRNWDALRAYTGKTFNVVHIDRSSIFVTTGETPMWKRISRDDFENVAGVWEAHLAGRCSRSKVVSLSHNTSYIVSILYLLTVYQERTS